MGEGMTVFRVIEAGKAAYEIERQPRKTWCYCCFDMEAGSYHTCPNCGQGYGRSRLPEHLRPPRPSGQEGT